MKTTVLIIAAAITIALLAHSAQAQNETIVCFFPGEDTQFQIPVTSVDVDVRTFAVAQACFDDFEDMPVHCSGGTITSETFDGSCRTVVCESDDGRSLQAKACEKKQFFFFGDRYVEVYRQEPLNTPNGLSVCFGDNCVGQWGFARSDFLPYCRAESEDVSCIGAIQTEQLRARIDGNQAIITNDADRAFDVGTAIYAQYNNVIEDQTLLDSATGRVEANSELRLTVDVPVCAWQWDVFCGEPIEDFNAEHYGDRNMYWEFSQGLPYCEQGQDFFGAQAQTNTSTRINTSVNTSVNTSINTTADVNATADTDLEINTTNVTVNATSNATVDLANATRAILANRIGVDN